MPHGIVPATKQETFSSMIIEDIQRPAWTTKIPLAGGCVRMHGFACGDDPRMHVVLHKSNGANAEIPTRLWIMPGAACSCLAPHQGVESSIQLTHEFRRFLQSDEGVLIALFQRPQDVGRLMMGESNTEGTRMCNASCQHYPEGQSSGEARWNYCAVRRVLASLGLKHLILEYPKTHPKSLSSQLFANLVHDGRTVRAPSGFE